MTLATIANPAAEDLVVEIAAWDGTNLPWRESYFFVGVMVVHLRDVPTPAIFSSWGRVRALYRDGAAR